MELTKPSGEGASELIARLAGSARRPEGGRRWPWRASADVQAILGHRNLKTSALCTRVVIEDLRGVLARAHPREWAWEGSRGL